MLRNLFELFDESFADNMEDRICKLENYFATVYPGKKDPEYIQRLKGMCREWEAECLWGYYGWQCQNIRHLRLGFYTGDIFTSEPSMDEDVRCCDRILEAILEDVNLFFNVHYRIETTKAIPRGQGCCVRRLYKAE